MDRQSALSILIAVISISALAIVAPTIESNDFSKTNRSGNGGQIFGVGVQGPIGDENITTPAVYASLTDQSADETRIQPTTRTAIAGDSGMSDSPYLLPLIGLSSAGILLLIMYYRRRLSAADSAAESDSSPDTRREIGRIAGATATRLEAEGTGDAYQNEIYRAWKQLTARLDRSHTESTTPAEFVEAAEHAGLAASDVRELTDLFAAVRYGGIEPTEELEQHAIQILGRIERKYASDQ